MKSKTFEKHSYTLRLLGLMAVVLLFFTITKGSLLWKGDAWLGMAMHRKNPRRVLHAVEICRQAGVPYSQLRTGTTARRPFSIVKVALTLPRAELFERINRRVDAMMAQGLEQEARSVYHLRSLNSLNTVGYKEMFAYFDGLMPLDVARERIKKNTRVYAKKQLTWLARDSKLTWCTPHDCLQTIEEKLKNTTNS